jgi:hypothetical protein
MERPARKSSQEGNSAEKPVSRQQESNCGRCGAVIAAGNVLCAACREVVLRSAEPGPSELDKLKAEKEARSARPAPEPPFAVTPELESRIQAAQDSLEGKITKLCADLQRHLAEHTWWRSIERDSYSERDRHLYEKHVGAFLRGLRSAFNDAIERLMDRTRETNPADGSLVVKWAKERVAWILDRYCDLAQLLDDGGFVIMDHVPEWIGDDNSITAAATTLRGRIDEELRAVAAAALLRAPMSAWARPVASTDEPPAIVVAPEKRSSPKKKRRPRQGDAEIRAIVLKLTEEVYTLRRRIKDESISSVGPLKARLANEKLQIFDQVGGLPLSKQEELFLQLIKRLKTTRQTIALACWLAVDLGCVHTYGLKTPGQVREAYDRASSLSASGTSDASEVSEVSEV